jgi:hypothetical protein
MEYGGIDKKPVINDWGPVTVYVFRARKLRAEKHTTVPPRFLYKSLPLGFA